MSGVKCISLSDIEYIKYYLSCNIFIYNTDVINYQMHQ